ncbi:MAG: beta strand repeat-containing protein [Gaiellaceae bacterium]
MRRRSILLGIALAVAGAYFARHESRRRPAESGTSPRPAESVVAVYDAVPQLEPRPCGGRSTPRRLTLVAVVVAVACVCAGSALAYWTANSASGSNGRSTIGSLGQGATPSVSLAGRTATVSWAQTIVQGSQLGSLASGGYTVRRYAVSAPGTPIAPGTACSSTLTGAADPLSCAESSLPTGRWLYTVTPTYYLWTGGTSSQSTAVTVAPDAPTSVALTNGGGTGNAFVNAANASSLSFDVVLPTTSLANDTVHLTVSDGSSTVTATTQAGIAGGGTRTFSSINTSSLADGSLTIKAWSTSLDGDDGPTTSISRTKDTVTPTLSTMVTGDLGGTPGKLDTVTVTFSEPLAAYTAATAPWTLANVPSSGALASVAVAGSTATLTVTEGAGAIDTTVGLFTIALASNTAGIRDPAGNLASFLATAPIDGIAPVETAMVMQDVNGNGKVDRVSVAFSETLASSTNTAPWTLANVPSGGTLSSVSTSGAVATLTISEGASSADTAVGSLTVGLSVSASGIRDAAGNMSSFAATAPTDGARPALVSMTMLDTNANGKVDRVTAVFSETLAAYTAATAPWTLSGTPSGGSLSSVSVSTNTATLTITEGGGAPDTAVGGFSIALATSATGIRDAAANLSTFGASAPADGAAPVRTAMVMNDVNANGRVDQVQVTFSEPLATSTDTTPWTLANVPSGGTLSSVSTSGSVATLMISEGAGAADTSVGSFTLALATSATGMRDPTGNQSSFTAAAPTDNAKPVLVSMTMLDTNTNGKIDHVSAIFSETLASSTSTSPWTLANVPSGGTLSSVSTAGATATLTLAEGASAADTSVGSFTVALATNASGIRDAAGNLSSFAATAPADGAAPVQTAIVMKDVNANGKVDQVQVTFSESLASSTDTTAWTLANVPSGGALSSVSTSGTVATLTISEGAGAADTSVGSFTAALAASATGIRDAAGNQASFAATAPTDGAKPVLLTLTMLDNNTNGKVDRVTAAFSETLAGYTAGNAPWTLSNTPSGGTLASVAVATTTATLTLNEGAGAQDTAVGSFTVALTSSATGIRDAAGNQSSFAATAPLDGAAPVPVSVATTNPGTIVGQIETNDALAVTFSEAILASSVPATTTITETGGAGNANDTLTIGSLTSGALSLGASNYVTASNKIAGFAASPFTVAGAVVTVTVGPTCVGNGCGSVGAGSAAAFTFTPAATITDAAGNTATGTHTTPATFRAF